MAKKTNDASLYYRAVSQLKEAEAPKPFSPSDLFPGSEHQEVAEKTADFFTAIADNFVPLDRRGGEKPTPNFIVEPEQVRKRLLTCRKPKGILEGDTWPNLVTGAAGYLSVPLAKIYNVCLQQCEWPSVWKLETVSVIPKKPHPTNLGDT